MTLTYCSVDDPGYLGDSRRHIHVVGVAGAELAILVPAPHVRHSVAADGNIVACNRRSDNFHDWDARQAGQNVESGHVVLGDPVPSLRGLLKS